MTDWVMLARSVDMGKLARKCLEGMADPSHLFDWPFCRVVAVYLSDSLKGEAVDISTREAQLAYVNRRRAAKGLPPLEG